MFQTSLKLPARGKGGRPGGFELVFELRDRADRQQNPWHQHGAKGDSEGADRASSTSR